MDVKKVLFISQEIAPYVPERRLSQIGRILPQGIKEQGIEERTFMPKYGMIAERSNQLHEMIRLSGMNVIIDDTDHPLIIKVATIVQTRIQVYFIDNEDYFSKRHMAQDEQGEDYADNGERAIFFARGVLETVKKLRWVPDIIHIQGWMGAVVPLYIKTAYHEEPSFANTKVVTSLFPNDLKSDLGNNFKKCIEFREATADMLAKYNDTFDFNELGKLAIDYSDGVIVSHKNVNKELIKYAKDNHVPTLAYPGEDFADAYENFYEKI